ncbi:MAG: tRNA pseudouridine(13) synthase TruD [Promethearchaeia archaeon]
MKLHHEFPTNDEREVEEFCGIETFASEEIEGIGGIYKRKYQDFIVKEMLDSGDILEIKEDYPSPPFSQLTNDNFTTFNLIKINMDTFEATRRLSRALNIPKRNIFYSGLKDKKAITVQKMSIGGNHIKNLKELDINDMFFRCINPTKYPVHIGDHWGNHFIITLRDIEKRKGLEGHIKEIIDILAKKGFPNYFGLQRFGTYRPNSHLVGQYLIQGEYKKAFQEYVITTYSTEAPESKKARKFLAKTWDIEESIKKFPESLYYERQILRYLMENPGDYRGTFEIISSDLKNLIVSSFQSYLFNKMISLRVEEGISLFEPEEGDCICILDEEKGLSTKTKYIYGDREGKYDKYLDQALEMDHAAIAIPIIGYDTDLEEFPLMKSLFQKFVANKDFNTEIFESPLLDDLDFKGTLRTMMIKPLGLRFIELEPDELYSGKMKLKIEFSLPKGSYATMLLREFIK